MSEDGDDLVEVTRGRDLYHAFTVAERAVVEAKQGLRAAKKRLAEAEEAQSQAWRELGWFAKEMDQEATAAAADKRVEELMPDEPLEVVNDERSVHPSARLAVMANGEKLGALRTARIQAKRKLNEARETYMNALAVEAQYERTYMNALAVEAQYERTLEKAGEP